MSLVEHNYHDYSKRQERLERRICRCGSDGTVYNLRSLISDGIILDPRQKATPLTTPYVKRERGDPEPAGSGYGRTFIFAINGNLDIHVAPDSDRIIENAVKHETLFKNANVVAAGEICFRDGKVYDINDHSGSYNTDSKLVDDPRFSNSILAALRAKEIPVAEELLEKLSHFCNV